MQVQLLEQSIFTKQIPLFWQVLFVHGSPGTHIHAYVFPNERQSPLFCVQGFEAQGSAWVVVVGTVVVTSKLIFFIYYDQSSVFFKKNDFL